MALLVECFDAFSDGIHVVVQVLGDTGVQPCPVVDETGHYLRHDCEGEARVEE